MLELNPVETLEYEPPRGRRGRWRGVVFVLLCAYPLLTVTMAYGLWGVEYIVNREQPGLGVHGPDNSIEALLYPVPDLICGGAFACPGVTLLVCVVVVIVERLRYPEATTWERYRWTLPLALWALVVALFAWDPFRVTWFLLDMD